MNTQEMIILANKNGKTYKSHDVFYNKNTGFTDSFGLNWGSVDLSDVNTWEEYESMKVIGSCYDGVMW
jgi:hypothetical protein